MPFIQRVGRLHIIMRVHQNRGLAGRMQPVGVEQRVALSRNDFDILHPDAAQFGGHKFRRFPYIALVFVEGADAWNPEKRLQLIEKTRLIAASKIHCGGSHVLGCLPMR